MNCSKHSIYIIKAFECLVPTCHECVKKLKINLFNLVVVDDSVVVVEGSVVVDGSVPLLK